MPNFPKFPGKASHESWIIGNYDVFVVFGGGRAGPIVAAGEEKILIGNGKFVVHVGGGPVEPAVDSRF